MTKPDDKTSDLPWSFPVVVSQIPEGGLHQVIETSPEQRGRLAALGRLRDVSKAAAAVDLVHMPGGRVHVTGHVKAVVGQVCGVSLDPIDNVVEEPIDVIFAPSDQIELTPKVVAREEGEDAEIPDAPEPIVSGKIDLGRLAAEILMLGIDPYPRKPDAVFEPPVEPDDPDAHPFAALKALQAPSKGKKKPKTH